MAILVVVLCIALWDATKPTRINLGCANRRLDANMLSESPLDMKISALSASILMIAAVVAVAGCMGNTKSAPTAIAESFDPVLKKVETALKAQYADPSYQLAVKENRTGSDSLDVQLVFNGTIIVGTINHYPNVTQANNYVATLSNGYNQSSQYTLAPIPTHFGIMSPATSALGHTPTKQSFVVYQQIGQDPPFYREIAQYETITMSFSAEL